MTDPQRPGVTHVQDLVRHAPRVASIVKIAARSQRAKTDGVEDGGDAGAGEFCVMRDNRRMVGPVHPGRGEMWRSRLSVCSSIRPGER